MIIAIDATGAVSLKEATDFKGFKVTTPNTDNTFLSKALSAAGRVTARMRGSRKAG